MHLFTHILNKYICSEYILWGLTGTLWHMALDFGLLVPKSILCLKEIWPFVTWSMSLTDMYSHLTSDLRIWNPASFNVRTYSTSNQVQELCHNICTVVLLLASWRKRQYFGWSAVLIADARDVGPWADRSIADLTSEFWTLICFCPAMA